MSPVSLRDVARNKAGLSVARHAVITLNGTWGAGLVQYPGLAVAAADPDLFYEVNCPYPATFGFIGGPATAPSYQQSIAAAMPWMDSWLASSVGQTFALAGYSQGAEAASQILHELMFGRWQQYLAQFIGGITFGNPSRGSTFVAPGVADPGGHGIATSLMAQLPRIAGQVVWADYLHSKANGDAGDDMYPLVRDPGAKLMTAVYKTATEVQLNNILQFTGDMVADLTADVQDVFAAPVGAFSAATQGLAFLAAPGGPTAPHISYNGELPGYSNMVIPAAGFLNQIGRLTLPRAAA